eukprot:GHUV01046564.1.p1 GENE.GHUV01046564.1~~GHUV01046564.1.p1  ORF type:complete len:190 (-),score=30.88 GHUV01046564.1:97-666(-)
MWLHLSATQHAAPNWQNSGWLRPRPDEGLIPVSLLAYTPQVLRSTGRWLLAAASTVSKGVKLTLLLTLELGMFPLAAGLWLDICALPLTSTSIEQRSELFAKTPFMAGFMHWALGLGFLLGFTFMVCVVREVLRPGALPFLKDPTNPERNPIREMLQEPLLRQLGRVLQSWVVHAGKSAVGLENVGVCL